MSEEGLFPQHPRSGDWETLEGKMLAPHIAAPLMSTAKGDSRHQTDAMAGHWDSNVIVTTGMTRGGGTMLK
jgi:hypothetical protein